MRVLRWPKDDEAIWALRRECSSFTAADPGGYGAAIRYRRTIRPPEECSLDRWNVLNFGRLKEACTMEDAREYEAPVLVLEAAYANSRAQRNVIQGAITCAQRGGMFAGAVGALRFPLRLRFSVVLVLPATWQSSIGIPAQANRDKCKELAAAHARTQAQYLALGPGRSKALNEALADAHGIAWWWAYLLDDDAD